MTVVHAHTRGFVETEAEWFAPGAPAAFPAKTPQLAIVVPCFNETAVLPETTRRLVTVLEGLIAGGRAAPESQVVYVDDGSHDGSWEMIESIAHACERVGGIKLSRNRGHQNALLAGLFTVDADAVISVDADLQDDVEAMSEMLQSYQQGVHVVYGVRNDRRSDGLFKRASAQAFYRVLKALGVESIYNHADYRLMSRPAIVALRNFGEVNLFLRGIVPLLGFKSSVVHYARTERFAGVSKYPLRKMLALALDGVTSFSVVPLRLITSIGFLVFLGSCGMGLWTLWVRLFTTHAVPGWTSTLLPIYFLGGIQILCVGIIGEYLGKVYQEAKGRPRYIIEKLI